MRSSSLRTRAYRAVVDEANSKFDISVEEAISATGAPEAARCYICLDGGDLVRGCACRGPDQGFAHVGCLIQLAEAAEARARANRQLAYFDAMSSCGLCKQWFDGKVDIAMGRAVWRRFAGYPKDDKRRFHALRDLGTTLLNYDQLDEAEILCRQYLADCRAGPRRGWIDMRKLLYAEELVASVELEQGIKTKDETKLRTALETLERVHAWRVANEGADSKYTLEVAIELARARRELGLLAEAEALLRETLNSQRRVLGESAAPLLRTERMLAVTLIRSGTRGKAAEARAILDRILATSIRVFGPENFETRHIVMLREEHAASLGLAP
jgi:tetratricopeptide (TPR) repeat protein